MKKGWKKGLALTLTAALGLSLAACGKTDPAKDQQTNGKENQTEAETYVYVPEYISIDSGDENSYTNDPILTADRLYYTKYVYSETVDETTGETMYDSDTYLCYRTYQNPAVEEEISLDFAIEGFEESLRTYFFDKEDNLYVVWYIYPVFSDDSEYDSAKETTYMVKYDRSGNEMVRCDIGSVFTEDNRYLQDAAVGGDGRIYASSNNLIYTFHEDCSFDQVIDVNADWIEALFSTDDGRIFYTTYGMKGVELTEIDTVTGKKGAVYGNLPDLNGTYKSGGEGKLLLAGSSRLYEYDLEAQEFTTVLEWLDCDVDGQYVHDYTFVDEGKIMIYYDNYEENPEFITLTKTDASEVTQKTVITLATLYEGNSELQRAAVRFNKSNDKYRIKIKSYVDSAAEWTENTYSDAVNRMNADLVSNNCPDIIDLSNADITNLAAKGALEDLQPYMDASTAANTGDFVPSVLNAYQYDGKQVTVPKTFTVATLLGKSKFVGTTPGWKLEDVIALAEAHPEAKLLYSMTKEAALQICLMYNNESFIDYETGKCYFDTPEFTKVLEFANCFPESFDYNSDESFPSMIQSDKVLLADANFYNVEEYQMYRLMLEDEATWIGYPTMDGSAGVFIQGSNMYGISSRSTNKDGAWKFIEVILSKDEDGRDWQFPTRLETLEAMFEESMTPSYQYDENGRIMYDENGEPLQYPKTSWGYDDWDADIYAATKEEIDDIRAMIDIAKPISGNVETIFSMISEEAVYYFAGQKSAEEVAKIIQSRVEIYVSENS